MVSYFCTFTFIIWWVAGIIRGMESKRTEAKDLVHRLNAELEERVSKRTAELVEANRQLQQQNQEIEMFVYSVSHDLRSPLVNLEGFSKELSTVSQELHTLFKDACLPAQLRDRGHALIDGHMAESIHFIQTAVLRLSTIIDALLRLSRAGRVQYAMQSVDLAETVARVVEALDVTIADHGTRVDLHTGDRANDRHQQACGRLAQTAAHRRALPVKTAG